MNMPGRIIATVLAVVLVLSLSAAAQNPQARYQLIPAQTELRNGERTSHEVFLLDTQTGKVWKFVAGIGRVTELPENKQGADNAGGSLIGVQAGAFVPVDRIEASAVLENRPHKVR